jgi:UDP-glucose 4-epimerase
MNKRTLIIGGTGFIGNNLTASLIRSGRAVTVLSRGKFFPITNVKGVNFVFGDFSNKELIAKLVSNSDEVVHLAYASVPNTSFDDPIKDLNDNLLPTVHLMQYCSDRGVRLIFISSGGTVYGHAQSLPMSETHSTNPISPYGVTKLTLENYAFLYAKTRGLSHICVRPSNPYGEGQRPFLGQGFISTAIATALQKKPIPIFGDQGTIRDYIYIDDLSNGILAAMDFGGDGEIYNIGSGIGRSNLEVLRAIEPILKKQSVNVTISSLPKRLFDVQENILDSHKLEKISGWKPVQDFGEGLKKTIQYIKSLDLSS